MNLDLRLAAPAGAAWVIAGVLVATPAPVAAWSSVVLWTASGALLCWLVLQRRARAGPLRAGVSASRSPDIPSPASSALRPAKPRGSWWAMIAVSCASGALVASVVAMTAPSRLPESVVSAATERTAVTAALTVWSTPVTSQSYGAGAAGAPGSSGAPGAHAPPERVRFRATLTVLTVGRDARQMSVPVVVFAETPLIVENPPGPGSRLRIGSLIELTGSLVATEPGDAASALFFGRSPPRIVAQPPGWLEWADVLRTEFSAAAARLPGAGADLLPGLAIGDTSAVDDTLDAAMKASSLSHLTAVSGANCAVVVAGIMLLTRSLGLRRRWRIAFSLAALLGFVVLVTPEPSVLRSAVMASVVLIVGGLGRTGRGVSTLCLVVIGLLAVDPWLSRNYGFTLSVLATGGLLLLAGPLTRVLARWMPRVIAAAIAIPLAAQIACQPVLLLLTPTLALYGVPANLLAAPAAPIATVIGLIACLLLAVVPWLATPLVHLAWLPSAWIAAVAQTVATLPGNRLPWLDGVPGVLLIALVTVLALLLVLRPSGRRILTLPVSGQLAPLPAPLPGSLASLPGSLPVSQSPAMSDASSAPQRRTALGSRPLWRLVASALLLIVCGAYAGTLFGTGIGRVAGRPGDWQIAACDVGQGDAVVVRDGSAHALVDVGPDPAPLTACLTDLGIDRIELLVLSHYDLDHIGGLDAVIGRVDHAIVGPPENAKDEWLLQRLMGGGASVTMAARGDTGMLGGLRWDVLWPLPPSAQSGVDHAGNAGSVTVSFEGRGIRSIFLGDLGEDAQNGLLDASHPAAVDVVKVAHHGSRDQSAALYARLHATVGLISVGADNGYGHPTQALLDLLASVGTVAVRTDLQGMIVVAPAAAGHGALSVWTERQTGIVPAAAAFVSTLPAPPAPATPPPASRRPGPG
ncbi:ComEC/Rec2 family competence protein [Leifsonia kafniensis]|uniref:ComEC/Rec2 family competence protein n=1 Tax=Leifsonia kafniensis TaxID=475957 RepID=A0ABP7K5K8_9MICO